MTPRATITDVMKAQSVHDRLVALLRRKLGEGWSQQSIADATHKVVSQSAISTYLSGTRKAKLDSAIAIARAVGEPDYFSSFTVDTRLVVDEPDGLAEYERAEGRLDDRYRDAVLQLASSEGPDAITADVVARHVETLRAIDRGRRIARPVADEAATRERPTAPRAKRNAGS